MTVVPPLWGRQFLVGVFVYMVVDDMNHVKFHVTSGAKFLQSAPNKNQAPPEVFRVRSSDLPWSKVMVRPINALINGCSGEVPAAETRNNGLGLIKSPEVPTMERSPNTSEGVT